MSDEYIRKADAIDAATQDSTENRTHSFRAGQARSASRIKAIPSADVAPVEYGEWIGVPEIWGSFDSRYYCSKCGNDAIINNRERYVLSDYCPHCGAIMDNKRGNENG